MAQIATWCNGFVHGSGSVIAEHLAHLERVASLAPTQAQTPPARA